MAMARAQNTRWMVARTSGQISSSDRNAGTCERTSPMGGTKVVVRLPTQYRRTSETRPSPPRARSNACERLPSMLRRCLLLEVVLQDHRHGLLRRLLDQDVVLGEELEVVVEALDVLLGPCGPEAWKVHAVVDERLELLVALQLQEGLGGLEQVPPGRLQHRPQRQRLEVEDGLDLSTLEELGQGFGAGLPQVVLGEHVEVVDLPEHEGDRRRGARVHSEVPHLLPDQLGGVLIRGV